MDTERLDVTRRLPPSLLALTPGAATSAHDVPGLVRYVVDLAQAGLGGCLLREPALQDADFLELATRLRDELPGFWLGVHDRLHIAISVKADAVHLGFRSLLPHVAKRTLNNAGAGDMAIGLSTHAGDDTEPWQAADYLFHGPVFETPSKVGLVDAIGPSGLRAAAEQHSAVWALGGIQADQIPAMFEAGASGVAVLGALAKAKHPQEVLGDLVAKLPAAGRSRE